MPSRMDTRNPFTNLAFLQLQNSCKDSMRSTLIIQGRFIQMLEMLLDELIPNTSSNFIPANSVTDPWFRGDLASHYPQLRIYRIKHLAPSANIFYAIPTDNSVGKRLWIAVTAERGEAIPHFGARPEDPVLTPLVEVQLDALYQDVEVEQTLQRS